VTAPDETQWYVIGKFRGSLDPDQRQEIHEALCAQLDEVSDVELMLTQDLDAIDMLCGACGEPYGPFEEHHCDLAPAGEAAVVGWLLLPALAEVARLAAQCFRMTTWHGEPRWLEFDANEDGMIHSDLGVMRLRDFRAHYTGGEM
jgi:hypothetical protein